MERVHSRESIPHKEIQRSMSREKSPSKSAAASASSSAIQRRESWRERSKSPGSRRASRTSRLESEDNDNNGILMDQNCANHCDPTKPLSPSLRRRRFHERKVPIARRSSSMSIGDPTDTYRAVRPFKSVDHYDDDGGRGGDSDREKKTIMVTDLDHAEVEMSKATRSTPNLSDLSSWSGKDSASRQQLPSSDTQHSPNDKPKERDGSSTPSAKLTIKESEAKIAAAVEDIDGVFTSDTSESPSVTGAISKSTPIPVCENKEEPLIDLRDSDSREDAKLDDPVRTVSSPTGNEIIERLQAERADSASPANLKNPLKSASASQVRERYIISIDV